MAGSPLAQPVETASFRLLLAESAAPEELRTWFEDAPSGGTAVYATGIVLPRDSAGVQLVTRWKNAGLVTTHQVRDEDDKRRWRFIVRKIGVLSAAERPKLETLNVQTRAEVASLVDRLRWYAERARECPSNAKLARELDLAPGQRGRDRAKYLLDLARGLGLVAVECRGRNLPRVVTILSGRAKGKATA